LKSYAADAGVREVFDEVADLFEEWATTGKRLCRGLSAFSPGERELLVSYVSALNACQYCFGSHCQIAQAWGIDLSVLDGLLKNIDTADV
jgi:AhpD family alkylhydroperoxidase